MSRYTPLDYRGEHDPDWPRIQTAVDDDRPARDDEVEYCEACGEPVIEGELKRHAGIMCCKFCRPYCPVCHDVEVYSENEFCNDCALQAMGVEL